MTWSTLILYIASSAKYGWLAIRGKISPVLTTWLFLEFTMIQSCWIYWHTDNPSFTRNIGNTGGLVSCTMIFVPVLIRHLRDHGWKMQFEPFERFCFFLGGLILIFWWRTDDADHAYVLMQLLALIAVCATAWKLWYAEENTEPLDVWEAIFVGGLTALYPAIVLDIWQSKLFLARNLFSTGSVIVLICRLEWNHLLREIDAMRWPME